MWQSQSLLSSVWIPGLTQVVRLGGFTIQRWSSVGMLLISLDRCLLRAATAHSSDGGTSILWSLEIRVQGLFFIPLNSFVSNECKSLKKWLFSKHATSSGTGLWLGRDWHLYTLWELVLVCYSFWSWHFSSGCNIVCRKKGFCLFQSSIFFIVLSNARF